MKIFSKTIKFFLFSLLLLQASFVLAQNLVVNMNNDNILEPNKTQNYYGEKNINVQYIPKSEIDTIKTINYISQEQKQETKVKPEKTIQIQENNIPNLKIEENKPIQKNEIKKEEKTEQEITKEKIKNIFVENNKDKIISQSARKINAIYPLDDIAPTNTYPGHRGPNQLVIYKRGFDKTTQTNEFGKEAVVEDGIVVALSGANSIIPRNGFVVSGHGNAKKWINDNLKIGTKIEIIDRTIIAYTTIESYRYFAKSKIKEVEDVLISTKSDYEIRDDKFIYYYLKKAKQQYKKSKKDNSEYSLNCAKESIKNASLAFQYTLPYLKEEFRGTWIRPNKKSIKEIQATLDKIKNSGIDNVFLETYYHGMTIFPSNTMKEYGFIEQNPIYSDFDALAVWIKEAHKRKIKIHTWFESFYVGNQLPQNNPKSILAQKPEWMNRTKQKADFKGYVSHPQEHNGYFLDPANPEVVEFLIKLIDEITLRYNVDGINIDYVRYPNISKENYNNQWGYTKVAREEFYELYELDPLELQPKSLKWDDWCEYRRSKITNYIQKVSNLLKYRDVVFSAVIFPDYKVSIQTKFQDWETWLDNGYLNAVTPLILTADEELAKSMLEEIRKKAYKNSLIYPGLFAGFIESDPEDLLRQIHIVRKLKLDGIVLFDWAHLNENYIKVLKTSVFKEQTY